MTPTKDETREVEALGDEMRPLLAGRSAQVQGFVLADLVATFLAGQIVAGDARQTRTLRNDLLRAHVKAVRALIPVAAKLKQ